MTERDHIFISYAVEQSVCADWLARRLAAAGYAVWYDRLKLLGGEPWPQDIDRAIKARTFRMLALLSKEALEKPNPTGERITAQQIAKAEETPDFLIPLNITGLRPTDIPWTLSPVNYISFSNGWAQGLAGVLEKLESVQAPRTLGEEGRRLAASARGFSELIHDGTEKLFSNCFTVTHLPAAVHRFIANQDVSFPIAKKMRHTWPCRQVDKRRFLAFAEPCGDVAAEFGFRSAGGSSWRDMSEIDGLVSRNVAVSLVHATLESHLAARGLTFDEHSGRSGEWFFPDTLLPKNHLKFQPPQGKPTWCYAVGTRTVRQQPYRYHLSPSFSVLPGSEDPFVLVLRLRVRITDEEGQVLAPRTALARRKHLCRNWWNPHWLARTFAVAQFLWTDEGVISVGEGKAQVVVEGWPQSVEVDVTLDETTAQDPDELLLVRDHELELEADLSDSITPEAEA